MGIFHFSFHLIFNSLSFFLSYPNLGIAKDPPYAYKDKTDIYDSSLNAQKVK
jgi:hypothetical protein